MNEEQIKELLLANFCDGDSWDDAKADRFTHEGALEIAKYFYTAGLSRSLELLPQCSRHKDQQCGGCHDCGAFSQASSAINEEINKSKA